MSKMITIIDDVIDSRDVIARIDELTAERDALQAEIDEAKRGAKKAASLALADWSDENAEELGALVDLADEADWSEDWQDGATLIRKTYFTDYCRDLVSDICDLPKDIPDYLVIDWEATADNIRTDYRTVSFAGVEYLIR